MFGGLDTRHSVFHISPSQFSERGGVGVNPSKYIAASQSSDFSRSRITPRGDELLHASILYHSVNRMYSEWLYFKIAKRGVYSLGGII